MKPREISRFEEIIKGCEINNPTMKLKSISKMTTIKLA